MISTMAEKKTLFEYKRASLNKAREKALFTYSIHRHNQPTLNFEHTIIFPKPIPRDISKEYIAKNLQTLHLALGLSYYKLYVPKTVIHPYKLHKDEANFWNTLYSEGLGEFIYRNNLNPKNIATFTSNKDARPLRAIWVDTPNRSLVGIGGGKDSSLVVELLKEQKCALTGLIIENGAPDTIARSISKKQKIDVLTVQNILDPKLFIENQKPDALNGHIPISAIWACISFAVASFYGYRYIITGNEHSSNIGNLSYKGLDINHQWSKSSRFETLFQNYTATFLTRSSTYFSLLRPFTELRIVSEFIKHKNLLSSFSSCNHVRTVHESRPKGLWCEACPKCAFTYLLLSAFLSKKELLKLFSQDLLDKPELLSTYKDLLGFGNLKPFDCVGTFEESQAALFLAKKEFADSLVLKTFIQKIKNGKTLVEEAFKTNPAPAIPAPFIFSGIHSVLLLGYGLEEKSFKLWLTKHYPNIKIGIADQKQGKDYLKKQKEYDLVIKTPSLPSRDVFAHHTTAVNIFTAMNRDQMIGITGTKGKSTVSSLIYHILKSAGKDVRLVGNIGASLFSALKGATKNTWFVTELSSYQLESMRHSPKYVVITNLFEDHMPYHGSVAAYHDAKKKSTLYQGSNDIFIYNQKDAKLRALAKETFAKPIAYRATKKYATSLQGLHNQENIAAAAIVAQQLGIKEKIIQKALESFVPLKHRLQSIGAYNDITFYDDAISTTPESTIAAIKTLKKIDTIFLGGEDRGYNFKHLEKILRDKKIRNIVLFPDSGTRILTSEKGFTVLKTKSMRAAVAFAYKHTKAGSICLLSTASPSYTLWENYQEKGNEFQKYVQELSPKKGLTKAKK